MERNPGIRALKAPLLPPTERLRESDAVSFADLLRLVAESVADAQAALDRSSASLVRELAETRVEVIPTIREVIDPEGGVTFEHGEPRTVSLLDLGVMPAFYQFSQTVVEVQMDLKLTESLSESGGSAGKRLALLADTGSVRFERKMNRDVSVSSKLTAPLVPVPMPLRMEPVRVSESAGEES